MSETKEGLYCGTTRINGDSFAVYQKGGHFGLVSGNKFCGHVKCKTLRKNGVFCPITKKKVYGRHGYVGAPKAA